MRQRARGCSWRALALIGGAVWCAGVLVARPYIFGVDWARGLLLLAPLCVLPLLHSRPGARPGAASLLRQPGSPRVVALWTVAVVALGFGEFMPVGIASTLCALPWALLLLVMGLRGVPPIRNVREVLRSPANLCERSAPLLGMVGAAWLLFDRAGVRPLQLPEELVLLTAIHFHYAGIALPVITARLLGERRDRLAWCTAGLATLGVPLVAGGITLTQLGASVLFESLAAWSMALGGLLVAWQLAVAARRSRGLARWLGFAAGVSLAAAMSLSFAYAVRHWLELSWMGIPWMRGVHGSLNALGFGVCGALFVTLAPRRDL